MEPVSPASPAPHLRRTPVQQRSAERLTRILDACAELLDESGYEELSTRGVAARAGVPIGSVYRFFGNKRALADALAHRNLDSYAERISGRLAELPAGDWRGALDAVLDEYVAMKRTMPGFALIDFGYRIPLGAPAAGANHEVAHLLAELLAGHVGRGADEELRRAVLVSVEAADALLQLAFRVETAGDEAIVAETREMLRAYLARLLD
ncbi:TetR/AcrR family transcriptional regulator [Streptomyces lunaelactis]|uniref:TetR/AcrR family transcriptional regulator n=1 Tax=Streptomyces lunaelactis TaxID=1535768 RepID=UPI0015850D04|nr:TetR/AcrR family transcriptional regulator [Streptomyces lunaelactis]NUK07918.1 TetR/AcrR family transcriptional regulator [Streptomyces lunaelactis]NUK33946.1 TetR/AcrR family transcriptional regulator [Streptomyces lunaelactis]NUK40685.1 TetR/AcrR family transcriptional regulator [Streptomyces lunaelactis]NUK51892.1 TetR/AcrR family transcriptional regulator [Streptomyces lunaelactis]NUK56962.1 TetR/AcrR family transcriptional regulator [Streptomyces lunaelactis]